MRCSMLGQSVSVSISDEVRAKLEAGKVESSTQFSVDWLRFTFKPGKVWDGSSVGCVLAALGLPVSFEERDRGLLNYDRSAVIVGGGLVAWGGDRQAGTILVDLRGSCLAHLRDVGIDVLDIMRRAAAAGAKCTRLDFAIDDKSTFHAQVRYDDIRAAFESGNVTMLAHSYTPLVSGIKPGESPCASHGWTFAVGSRDSGFYIRIYNKAAEQGYEGHWVRVEPEVKGDLAQAFFLAWASVHFVTSFAIGFLRSRLDFKQSGNDSNISRRQSAPWWADFLGYAERVRVSVSARARSLADVYAWLERSCSASIALVASALGYQEALDWLDRSFEHLKKRDLELLERWEASDVAISGC